MRGALLHDYFLYDWHKKDDGASLAWILPWKNSGEKRKTGLSAEPVGGIYHCKAHVSADGSAAEIQGGVDGLFGG